MAATKLRRRFALEFLNDRDITKAWVRAGGALSGANRNGHLALADPDTKGLIEKYEQAALPAITRKWIATRLVRVMEDPDSNTHNVIMAADRLSRLYQFYTKEEAPADEYHIYIEGGDVDDGGGTDTTQPVAKPAKESKRAA